MNLQELKGLIQNLGGVLVMDGDKPSFVLVSYENYQQLIADSEAVIPTTETPKEQAVRKEIAQPVEEFPLFETVGAADVKRETKESDEDRIRQLNEEVALLRQEIRQREVEELLEEQA